MSDAFKEGLQHLDAAHLANCRISSLSALLMAWDNPDLLEVEDVRVLAELIHGQSEIVRDCLGHFRQVVETNQTQSDVCR